MKLRFHTEVEKLITNLGTLATNYITIQSSLEKCFPIGLNGTRFESQPKKVDLMCNTGNSFASHDLIFQSRNAIHLELTESKYQLKLQILYLSKLLSIMLNKLKKMQK